MLNKDKELLQRSLNAVWHPCTQMKHHQSFPLISVASGKGSWLYDFNGNRYLDVVSSWWVNLFGHCNPRISEAIRDQLEKLEHVMLAGFTHEPVVQLSERLSKVAPAGLGHCFYASDGASAIEIALKMSFHYWRNIGKPTKTEFISLAQGYHGETLGALSVTDVALFKDVYSPLLKSSIQMPSPDWRHAEPEETPSQYALRCAKTLESYLEQHHQSIAAFIIEPLVQGATGMAMYHPEYLSRVRKICDRFDVHLIADEIAMGFGRTGTMFACEQADMSPDFLCLSKGLSGGYLPLSVVMTQDKIYQAFYHEDTKLGFLHSHSYTGNPLACRAALATLDIFEQDNVISVNKEKTRTMSEMCMHLKNHPKVKNFRNTGMIWAFEVKTSDNHFSRRFFEKALSLELLLRPIGNTVYFMPPYTITNEELNFMVTQTLRVIESIAN